MFADILPLLVETVEAGPRHEYLATYLKGVGIALVSLQHEWYASYRLHVGGDIIAVRAVAACHCLYQSSLFVCKRY